MTDDVAYVLGSSSPEVARLDAQSAAIESGHGSPAPTGRDRGGPAGAGSRHGPGTRGVRTGEHRRPQRVGGRCRSETHECWRLPTPGGTRSGLGNVRFVEGDARTYHDDEAVRRRRDATSADAPSRSRSGGQAPRGGAAPGRSDGPLDYDGGAMRAEPKIELVEPNPGVDGWPAPRRERRRVGRDAPGGASSRGAVGGRRHHGRAGLSRARRPACRRDVHRTRPFHGPGDHRRGRGYRGRARDWTRCRIASSAHRSAADAVLLPPTLVAAWGLRR